MKKVISLLLASIIIIGAALSLVACGAREDGVPVGMQLAYGSDSAGYYFYVPEEWTVANQGHIKAAYVSQLDTTSVSFVKTEMPEAIKNPSGTEAEGYAEYFATECQKMPAERKLEVTLNPTECDFGAEGSRADKAYKAAFRYEYSSGEYVYKMGCMQIYITNGDDFYIFTYTSSLAPYSGEQSYYDFHLERIERIITSFKFVGAAGEESTSGEYPKKDGYYLISDKTHTKFDFYMPEGYKVDFPTEGSSFVSISGEGKGNITMAQATYAATGFNTYWQTRIDQLKLIATNVSEPSEMTQIDLGEEYLVAAYVEYTYTLDGEDYKVYQAIIKESKNVLDQHIFVFTYTAPVSIYDANLDEATEILQRVEF